MSILKNISAIFTALIGINYFYSFWIINKILEKAGVSTFSILSVQDLLLPLAGINILIIIFCGFLFLTFIGVKHFIKHTDFLSLLTNPIESIKIIRQAKKKWNRLGFKEKVFKASFSLILYLSIIVLIIHMIKLYQNNELLELTIICFLFCFLALIIWFDKFYNRALAVFIIGLVFLGWLILKESFIKASKETNSKDNNLISFIYVGDTIKSDNHNKLVFYGSRYIVMYNDSSKETALFETTNVTHFAQHKSVDTVDIKIKKQK